MAARSFPKSFRLSLSALTRVSYSFPKANCSLASRRVTYKSVYKSVSSSSLSTRRNSDTMPFPTEEVTFSRAVYKGDVAIPTISSDVSTYSSSSSVSGCSCILSPIVKLPLKVGVFNSTHSPAFSGNLPSSRVGVLTIFSASPA